MISAFIPFHMFNDTLLSLMFLFLYQTEQLSAVPLGGNVPLIHSLPDRALGASMRFVLITHREKGQGEREREREMDLRNHQIISNI